MLTTRKRLYGLMLMMLFFSPLAHAVTTSIDGFYRYQNETDYKTSPYQKDGTGIVIPETDAKIPISDALVGLRIDIQEAQNGQQWQWEYFDPNGVSLQKSIMTFYDSYLGQNGCFVFSFFSYACGALNGSGINGEVTLRTYCREVGKYSLKFTAPDPLAKTYNFELISTGPKAEVRLNPSAVHPKVNGGGSPPIPNVAAGTTDATVQVTDSGCPNLPLADAQIELTSKVIPGSGGHAHIKTEAPGTGTFTSGRSSGKTVTGVTDRNGQFLASYTASDLGIEENIIAKATVVDSQGVAKTVEGQSKLTISVEVKTPLTPVPALSPYWVLKQTAAGAANHPINNYARPQLLQVIQSVASAFKSYRQKETGQTTVTLLSINDISLPLGGRFEGHDSHELGVDLDINGGASRLEAGSDDYRKLKMLFRDRQCTEIHFIHFRCEKTY